MITAQDIKDALHRRYNKPSQGNPGERYVCIEEARSGAGFEGNQRQCDFLAINTWKGRGMELLGHEIKVSKADWRAELDHPEKAEAFARLCRRWWVVVPSGLAKEIRDEVPPAWGLMSCSDGGRVTEVVKAPARQDVRAVPEWWWIGWLAQIDRQHKRGAQRAVAELMAKEREKLADQVEAEVARRRQYADREIEALRKNVHALKHATGIDLGRAWLGSFERLAAAWELAQGVDLARLVAQMRMAADALEGVSSEATG